MKRVLRAVACVVCVGAILSEPALAERAYVKSRVTASGPDATASVSAHISISSGTSGGSSFTFTGTSSGGGSVKLRASPPHTYVNQSCPTACTVTEP